MIFPAKQNEQETRMRLGCRVFPSLIFRWVGIFIVLASLVVANAFQVRQPEALLQHHHASTTASHLACHGTRISRSTLDSELHPVQLGRRYRRPPRLFSAIL